MNSELKKTLKIKSVTWTKIIIASSGAIFLSILLNLQFAISAGIVAILSVLGTKKETFKTALERFAAFCAALFISFIFYNIFGFNTKAFILYLCVFIAMCQIFEWYSAMALDSVLISHFLIFNDMTLNHVLNEVLLFAIGAGTGLLSNLFLRKRVSLIEELKSQTDSLIVKRLERMGERIKNINLENFDGTCFEKLDHSLFEAKKQAEINFKNQFGKNDTYDIKYIAMREKQISVLKEMFKVLIKINDVPFTADTISDFFIRVAKEYHKDNDVESLLENLSEIRSRMKIQKLPETRAEFENRANLFCLMNLLEEFLKIKSDFFHS